MDLLARQEDIMPAKNIQRIDEDGLFLHIYNKGVENRLLFNDEEDYKVFDDYVREYLTVPQDPESTKKTFQVHGKTFKGTPHLPKNYHKVVELIAYSLMPDHFHLLVRQVTKGSLVSFMRSLCTRYSIYFNKKYSHTGSLFAGPYQSTPLQFDNLAPLTRFFHFYTQAKSSYQQYLGVNSWIRSDIVLDSFDDGKDSYKDYVGKYQPNQLLERTLLEAESKHLARSTATDIVEPIKEAVNAVNIEKLERREPTSTEVQFKPKSRVTEFVTASTVFFLLLVTVGIRNIWIAEAKVQISQSLPSSAVLAQTQQATPSATPEATASAEPETTAQVKPEVKPEVNLTVKISDGSPFVNIRQKPTVSSQKVGQANDGDNFELVSKQTGWYEIKLTDGSKGFISTKYAVVKEGNH